MNEIDFTVLDNQIGPPSTLNSTPIPSQSTPFGLLHHQSTVDIFTIRAYNLLSNGAIINSNQLQSIANSPHNTMHTPAPLISNTNVAMKVLTTDEGLLKLNDMNNINENNKLTNDNDNNNTNNANNNSITNNNTNTISSNNNNNVNNTPDSVSTFGSNNTLIHNAYPFNIQLFQKISSIYTAIISSSVMNDIIDKSSSSPKSAIELFQRFIQILKELELGFEVSPYAKYFHRLDEHLWQIKNDSELIDDKIWQSITTCIFAVYDPQTGKLINPNNIRVRKSAPKNGTNNNNSSGIDDNNNLLIESRNNINNDTIINNHENNSNNNVSNTPSSNSSNPDDKQNTTLTSNSISTDTTITTNTKSKKKYARKKATTVRQTTGKKTTKNTIQKSTWKNNRNVRTISNITDEVLTQQHQNQQEPQQQHQLLQDSSQNKSSNGVFVQDGLFSQQLQRRLQSIFMNRDDHINLSRSLNGYYTQPTSPGHGFDTSLDNNPQLDFNNFVSNGNQNPGFYNLNGPVLNNVTNNNNNHNNSNNNNNNSMNSFQQKNNLNNTNGTGNNLINNNINNNVSHNNNASSSNSWKNKGMDLNTLDSNTMDQMLQFNTTTNVSIENGNSMSNNNNNMDNSNMISTRQNKIDNVIIENLNKQMKEAFEQIVQEKDQRIMQLERELQTQRQETQWLRRMLIEDMGCVRSMLQDIKKD